MARIKFEFSNDPRERNLQMLEKLLEVDPTSYDPSVAKPETSNENYLQWLLSEGVCQGLLSFLLRPSEVKPQGHPRFKGTCVRLPLCFGPTNETFAERPLGDEKATRRSYHLMKLFLSWDKYFSTFVKAKLADIGMIPTRAPFPPYLMRSRESNI